jgi:LysR family transcriptional regulator of beta-lactamase
MFARQLAAGAIEQPFAIGITTGSYWLTRLQSRPETSAMAAFKQWLLQAAQEPVGASLLAKAVYPSH